MDLHDKTLPFLLTVAAENRMAYLEPMVRPIARRLVRAARHRKNHGLLGRRVVGGQKERLRGNLKKALARKWSAWNSGWTRG